MPHITVIIASYNSSPFIVETLNSVLKQTWKEIELIITDDCSADNTVNVCRSWIDENKDRFVKNRILTSDINTGVSANANRGLKEATGEWVKFLGADDALTPECLSDNMQYVNEFPLVRVLFSKINVYRDTFEMSNLVRVIPGGEINQNSILRPDRSAESQYRMLLISDRIHYSPSVFIHRKTLLSVGAFDERFRLLEDYPLWLNLTKNGHKLFFMGRVTVNYRIHSRAINNTGIEYLVNPNYYKSEYFRKIYVYPFLPADIRHYQQFNWYASQVFRSHWLNRKGIANKILLDLLTVYLNPFTYFILLKKSLKKSLKYDEFYM